MIEALENQRAEVERHRENSARLAQAFAKFESSGQGFIEFEERVDFGLTFIEEPYVTYGAQMDLDAFEELLDREADADTDLPPVPMMSGIVTAWDQDNRGFYVGAWVGARVYCPPEDAVPVLLEPVVSHHYTFTAVAIKDVPVDVRD